MNDHAHKLHDALSVLILSDAEFEAITSELSRFCPFEASSTVRAEIRHSHFLASMLNPQGTHQFGSRFLRAFLIELADHGGMGRGDDVLPLDVHFFDLDEAQVHHQWRVDVPGVKNAQQAIDFVIEIPSAELIVAVELKIDASQSERQLRAYREKIEQSRPTWKHALYFLTKYDEPPADDLWVRVPYGAVVQSIDRVLPSLSDNSLAAQSLHAYGAMLRRHHMDDKRLVEIAQKLWAKHSQALEFLMNNRPDGLRDVFEKLKSPDSKKRIEALLRERLNKEICFDSEGLAVVGYAVADWDDISGFKTAAPDWTETRRLILFEIKREGVAVVGTAYLGPGEDAAARQKFFDAVEKIKRQGRGRVGQKWTCLDKATLFKLKDEDKFDPDDVAKAVERKFQDFMCRVVPNIDEALQTLRSGGAGTQDADQ